MGFLPRLLPRSVARPPPVGKAAIGPASREGEPPSDRVLLRASAEAFSVLGYYGVSMETIATRVGISAAALYRHYSSKYELFCDAVLSLGQQLVDCTAFADDETGDPELTVRRLVSALVDTAMANRESGGLYRWEGRYLRGDDQATLIVQMRTVHRRIHRPLMAIRPELTSQQAWTLSASRPLAERAPSPATPAAKQEKGHPEQQEREPRKTGAARSPPLDFQLPGPGREQIPGIVPARTAAWSQEQNGRAVQSS